MKVLLATHFFPPGQAGGTEAYTLGLARALLRKGHDPFVLCAGDWDTGNNWDPVHEDSTTESVPVRRLSWNWRRGPDPFVNLYDNPWVDRCFERYVDEIHPDVVHMTSCYTLGAGILRRSRDLGLPTFLTLTDFWFLCPRHTLLRGDGSLCSGPESPLKCQGCMASHTRAYKTLRKVLPEDLVARTLLYSSRWPAVAGLRPLQGYVGDTASRLSFLLRAFSGVDAVLAPSPFLRDLFAANGFPGDRIRLNPYGIDQSWCDRVRERPSGSRVCLGYMGQIEPIKGVHLLVDAFRSVSHRDAELRIYGDLGKNPAYATELRRLAGGLPNVEFRGPFERQQLADVFSEIDGVVVPSLWHENSPLVIAEAFAAGRPVIATNLGGIADLVHHNVNGLLFERDDADSLANALSAFIDDAPLRERLGQAIGRVRTIEEEVDELLTIYGKAGASTRFASTTPALTSA